MASYVLQTELAGEWEGYEFLRCPAWPGMTTVFPLCKVCLHTGIPFQQCQSWLAEGNLHGADKTCVLYGRACLEKKKKHVKLGLLQEESVPASGLFLLME